MYYRGDGAWMGLFEPNGSYRKKAYAFKALGMMLDTPQRLAATGADTYGLSVLAGRSGDRKTVQILITNYEIPEKYRKTVYRDNRGYRLKVTNLPWGERPFQVKRYRTTGSESWAESESSGEGGTIELGNPLPPPGMELIVISRRGK